MRCCGRAGRCRRGWLRIRPRVLVERVGLIKKT
nr:MAG TPA: glycogen synthase kinase [Caudoviricetes sp.]